MASEDSDELVSGFSPVHRLNDLDDVRKTFSGLVMAGSDEFDAEGELLEVESLGTPKRMGPKERDYPLEEVLSPANRVAVQMLPVVV